MFGRCCKPLTGAFEREIDCFAFFFCLFLPLPPSPPLRRGRDVCDQGVETNMSLFSMPPLKEKK